MFEITTDPDDFNAVTAALEGKGYAFVQAAIEMVPQNYIKLTDEEEIKNMGKPPQRRSTAPPPAPPPPALR